MKIKITIALIIIVAFSIIGLALLFIGDYSYTSEVEFHVINNSAFEIEGITFTSSNDIKETKKIESIKIGIDKKISLDMSDGAKVEGGYKMTYNSNGKDYSKKFGYFTNGIPINWSFTIYILDEDIKIIENMYNK